MAVIGLARRDGGSIVQYPFTRLDAMALKPGKSVGRGAGLPQLTEMGFDVVEVHSTPRPTDTHQYSYSEVMPVWDGGQSRWQQAWAQTERPLDAAKAKKIEAIKARFAAIVSAGFSYRIPNTPPNDLHTYQIEALDQANMTSVAAAFNLGVPDAHGGFWRDVANVNVPMTQPECEAFFTATLTYKAACVRRMWTLITAAEVAADYTALNKVDEIAGAIDRSGSWPVNGS